MSSHYTNHALVFNCYYNGLGIIQELGRRGVKVHALDRFRNLGTFSRYADFWKCPDPISGEEAFIDYLLAKGPGFTARPVLFPTMDHWAVAISKHKSKLEQYYIPCVADWDAVELTIYKDKFYRWAMNQGYPVPSIYSFDEVMLDGFSEYPIIAKPRSKRLPDLAANGYNPIEQFDKNRMVLLHDRSSLFAFTEDTGDLLQSFIFQEYVPGMANDMFTIGIYANKDYDILGLFMGKKVRGYPPDIGDCVVGQAEKLPLELVGMVGDIVKKLRFHGIAEFEFKRNQVSGEFRLIEINPRSWTWIGITPACGVSLPWIAYADLTGAERMSYTESNIDRGDVKYIRLLQDFTNCLYSNKRAGFPEYQMGLREWWKSLEARKKVYAEFSWDDPMLGLYSLMRFAGRGIASVFKKVTGRRNG